MANQVLKTLGGATTVTAVDTAADKLEIAKRKGADEGLLSGDAAVTASRTSRGERATLV